MTHPAELTITEANSLIAKRSLTGQELVNAVLDRIERFDPVLRCYIAVTADTAIATAERADTHVGRPAPLAANPVSLKDVIDIAGIPTTAGSAALLDNVPEEDSLLVERLMSAGAAITGKNTMHELGLGVTTASHHFGRCRNPWNPDHIPGGSSGGSAAAVAAGLALASIGGDSGGSIRIPAAFNNLVGLKPTHGLMPTKGVFTGTWSLDSTGPITRTVEDNAILLQCLAGSRRTDYRSFRRRDDLSGIVVGVPDDYFFEGLHADVATSVMAALGALERLGAAVVEVPVPSARYAVDAGAVISWSEYATSQAALIRAKADLLGNEVRSLLEVASTHLATDYLAAQQARTRMINEYRAAWGEVDVIATPTSAFPPPPVGEPVMFEVAKLTRIASLTGEPALSVPCGFTTTGLPIGLHLQAPRGHETRLYEVGYAYEQAAGWWRRRPDPFSWDAGPKPKSNPPFDVSTSGITTTRSATQGKDRIVDRSAQ